MHSAATAELPRGKRMGHPNSSSHELIVASSIVALACAFACWELKTGSSLLFVMIVMMNLAPFVQDVARGKFDLLSPRNLFLGYFFVLLTLPTAYCLILGVTLEPNLAVTPIPPELRARALAAILAGLSTFLVGAHLRIGIRLGRILPAPIGISRPIGYAVALGGLISSLVAFGALMQSAGGMQSFMAGLGSWRTLGMSGIGQLIVPTTVIGPGGCLLLLLFSVPPTGTGFSCRTWVAILLSLASLVPIALLGFRIALFPVVLQYTLVWHLRRRAIGLRQAVLLAVVAVTLALGYSSIRESMAWGGNVPEKSQGAYLYRVSGLETVERIIWQLDQGGRERTIGVGRAVVESISIVVPRALWPSKPEPASLTFVDAYFFDYFINRGDPLAGVRSGVSATIIGELLGTGGVPLLLTFSFCLGVAASLLMAWRSFAPNSVLVLFTYITVAARFPLFAEAPQNTANTMVILVVLCACFWVAVSLPRCLWPRGIQAECEHSDP